MDAIKNFLSGKKTYIIAACMAIVVLAQQAGLITADQGNQLLEVLGVGGVITLRAAVAKS